MGLMIPGELADLLNELGYIWPKSDETKLFELGQQWIDFASGVDQIAQDADTSAALAWSSNRGEAIEAFKRYWSADDAPSKSGHSGTNGSFAVGGALIVCAAAVLALKINVIVQITILVIEIAEAVATAVPTFGASLLEIPVFKKLTDMVINLLISEAMEVVLG